MKKELLLASALVGTLALPNVAQAVTMTMSGSHEVGIEGESPDGTGNDATARSGGGSGLAVSLSETTDGGITISSGFSIMNESTTFSNSNSGVTLTFTDGSALDLVSAGNASDSHDVSIPSSAGSEGIAYSTGNKAPGGIDFAAGGDAVGFEYKSAADALGIDGMSFGVSAAFNNDAPAAVSSGVWESGYGVGVTYVTTAGDTSVTIGAGFSAAQAVGSNLTKDENISHIGLSATTGNLTIGAGFATGDTFDAGTGATSTDAQQTDATVTEAGATYVSGDITFSVGTLVGEGKDEEAGQSGSGVKDKKEETSASVSYAVASGVTAIVGWTAQEEQNEGTKTDAASGSSWYVGANLSF
jgi:hypothetical protein